MEWEPDILDLESIAYLEDVRALLENNQSKRIYCFGGGSAAEIMMENLFSAYNIQNFLDNNSALWGKKIGEIEIRSPQILLEEEKESYIVLILSRHYIAISEQLEEYGLRKNREYYEIYSRSESYFHVKRFAKTAVKFADFVMNIPEHVFEHSEEFKMRHIGVICIATMVESQAWYPIALFLLLRYCGYQVTLIVDTLHSFDDIVYFEQYTQIAKVYIDHIVNMLRERFPELDICYIDQTKTTELDEADVDEIRHLTDLTVKWQNARPAEYLEESYIRAAFEDILTANMKVLKAFFAHHHYDTINVISGAHKHRGLYTWEGKRQGIPVSTYDGNSAEGYTLFSSDGPCSYHYDIAKVIQENMCDEQLKRYIIDLGRKDFQARINTTYEDAGYNYQRTVEVDQDQKIYDVIIPLNVNYDMAGIGIDRVFTDEREWLFGTVDYLIEHTDASIMVREHPSLGFYIKKGWKGKSYEEEFDMKYQKNDRICFCSYNQPINTYRMIERSKVVLPYSSTTGIEAYLLGKPVITHTDVYYSNLNFVYNAQDKDDYYSLITRAICGELDLQGTEEEAYMAYCGLAASAIRSEFTERKEDWMTYSLNELIEQEGVRAITSIVAENMSPIYINYKRIYNIGRDTLRAK